MPLRTEDHQIFRTQPGNPARLDEGTSIIDTLSPTLVGQDVG
jgi:hypothetical protein